MQCDISTHLAGDTTASNFGSVCISVSDVVLNACVRHNRFKFRSQQFQRHMWRFSCDAWYKQTMTHRANSIELSGTATLSSCKKSSSTRWSYLLLMYCMSLVSLGRSSTFDFVTNYEKQVEEFTHGLFKTYIKLIKRINDDSFYQVRIVYDQLLSF